MFNFKSKNKYLTFIYNALIIIMGGFIVYLLYKIVIYFTKGIDTSVKYKKLLVLQSTLTNSEAQDIAKYLFDAMDRFGTLEDRILEALKPLTRADFEKVYVAFGKRAYVSWFGTEANGWGKTFDSFYHDLRYWLEEELSVDEYLMVAKMFGQTSAFPFGEAHNMTAEQYYLSLHGLS